MRGRAAGARKVKVFLDSSVLIAAVLSPTGGSFRLLQEASAGHVSLITNQYVFEEVARVLREKYPQFFSRFRTLVAWGKIHIRRDPSSRSVRQYTNLIVSEDAPVLAGAIAAKTDFLATLDRKHFLASKLETTQLPVVIGTPGDFFQQYWFETR